MGRLTRLVCILSIIGISGLIYIGNYYKKHRGLETNDDIIFEERRSNEHAHKRIMMGGMVKQKLHIKDTIFKHAAVATDNKECSKIGRNILTQNGSAVDSAIASMLCLGVMNAHSTGIGGGGFMMVYIREKKKATVIDFRESAPSAADKDLFKGDPQNGIRGGLAVAIPGELRGMELAHQKFGNLEWARLFEPAIKLAREGFPITDSLHIAIHKWKKDVKKCPCLRRIYMRKGKLLKKGDKIYNPQLANTLEKIANSGNANLFYTGDMAKQFVKDVKKQKGVITETDLQGYTAVIRDPVISSLNKYTVLTAPPPASGPIFSFILNILKGYNMSEEFYQSNQPLVYHRLIEAFNFAYAKRTELADPDIEKGTVRVVSDLLDEDFAEETRKKISDEKTFNVDYYNPTSFTRVTTGTTHLVVIAPNGDGVSVTSTVNGYLGAKFRSCEMGFIYNNEMDDFSTPGVPNEFGLPPSEVNFIKPNKRPLSSSAPVVLLDKHMNIRLIAGGSGGSIITTAVAQVLMNNVWFGMNMKDAVQQPRVHAQLIPATAFAETRMPEDILKKLEKFGHNITVTDESHAVVQAIARVDNEWHTVCKKGKIQNSDFTSFCLRIQKDQVGFFAESDYRKGGEPDGF